MNWTVPVDKLAERLGAVAQRWVVDGPAERADRARRNLLAAIAEREPSTLNEVAANVGRGAPAVSRAVDALVRSGHVERAPDPDNRRRLCLRLTEDGRKLLDAKPKASAVIADRLGRLAQSELRAVERAVEILER
ncbi:winged helix DNA-binding protein [Sphingomonas piscis]|uniref:Winged helix DNA-binding protein n=1 Tax=Sphingomonas piscis TaxID=2714943 RepID=A0A6G7YRF5_9SPHN|nr:MarR family transcriptional regulator [Sphingomonas piscis]QIK79325.1 winged helix DNA-binding protein [Sphingomonas piscis]